MSFRYAFLAAATALTATLAAAPAAAAVSATCSTGDISPAAEACVAFAGNLNSNSPADRADQLSALQSLGYTGSTLSILETLPSLSGTSINFATLLEGTSFLAVHFGSAGGRGGSGNATVFFRLTASNLDVITATRGGLSNARLFQTGVPAVPEPGTWAMMLLGFGAIGFSMRRAGRAPALLQVG